MKARKTKRRTAPKFDERAARLLEDLKLLHKDYLAAVEGPGDFLQDRKRREASRAFALAKTALSEVERVTKDSSE